LTGQSGASPTYTDLAIETMATVQAISVGWSKQDHLITHWSHWITFLGYQIRGKLKRNGVSLSPILKIPNDKFRKIVKSIDTVAGYYSHS